MANVVKKGTTIVVLIAHVLFNMGWAFTAYAFDATSSAIVNTTPESSSSAELIPTDQPPPAPIQELPILAPPLQSTPNLPTLRDVLPSFIQTPATVSATLTETTPTPSVTPAPEAAEDITDTRKLLQDEDNIKLTLQKRTLNARENIKIKLSKKLSTVKNMKATIRGTGGTVATDEPFLSDDNSTLEIPRPRDVPPGQYTVTVHDGSNEILKQNFTWGVLAFNTNKATYTLGEEGYFQMSVLDSEGHTVCDADLTLKITNVNGFIEDELSTTAQNIHVTPECRLYTDHMEPDYEARYRFEAEGIYDITLSATTEDGTYDITDTIEVAADKPFEIERTTVTRVYPPVEYPVKMAITAHADFKGTIVEYVPASFQVEPMKDTPSYESITEVNNTKELRWNVSIKKDERIIIGYRFRAPPVSPEFYLIGPLTFVNTNAIIYKEARYWQLAADVTISRVTAATVSCANGGATSISCTLGATPTNGNALFAVIGTRGTTTGRVSSITQTGATWARQAEVANSNGVTTEIWAAFNVSGANTSVTINLGASLKASAVLTEYSGIANSGALDKTASTTGSSTSPSTNTTATTTQAKELWIGGMANINTNTYSAQTNSFSEVAESASTGGAGTTRNNVVFEEKIVTTTGTANVGATLSGTQQWAGVIATFKAKSITISGTVYSDEAGSPTVWTGSGKCDGTTQNISLSVNGATKTSVSCNATTAVFSFTGVDVATGDIITIFLDTNGGAGGKGVLYTKTASDTADITGLTLRQNRVWIQNETTGSITNTNINIYDGSSQDTDIPAQSDGTNLTVSSGVELHINTGDTFAPGGNVTVDNMHVVGTYTGASETLTLTGSGTGACTTEPGTIQPLCISGTFTSSSNTVNYTGTSASTIASTTYNNLGVGTTSDTSSVTYTLGGNTTVSTVLTISNASATGTDTLAGSSYTLTLSGNSTPFNIVSGKGTYSAGTSTVTYTNTTSATLTAATYYDLTVNPASGTPTYTLGSGTFTISRDFSIGNGTVASTVSTTTNSPTISVTGDLTVNTSSTLSGSGTGTITVNSNVKGGGAISLTAGTFEQRVATNRDFGTTTGTATYTFNNLTFSNSTSSPATITTHSGGSGGITVNGSLLVGKSGDTSGGTTTLDAGARTWTLTASSTPFTILASPAGSLTASTSTFNYTGTSSTNITSAIYNNMGAGTTSDSSAVTYTLGGNVTVNALATVGNTSSTNNDTLALSSYTLTLKGSGTPLGLTSKGLLSSGTGTVSYENTTSATVKDTTYYNLQFNPASGTPTYTLGAAGAGGGSASATKINDTSNFGTLVGAGKQIARTSAGVLYAVLNNAGSCEVWKAADGSSWAEQNAANNPSCYTGTPIAVALDSADNIHIIYASAEDTVSYVKFTTSTDTFGSTETVDNTTLQLLDDIAIAVDSNDKPHAIMSSNEIAVNTSLKYSNRVSGSWKSPVSVISTVNSSFDKIALTIDEDNLAEMAYERSGTVGAAIANVNDATSFTTQNIDASAVTNSSASSVDIGIDSGGNTWVTYLDDLATDYITLVKHNDADAWTTWQTPTNNGDVGSEPSLAVIATDVYVFFQNSNNDVAFDQYGAGAWTDATVLETGTYQDVKVKNSYLYNNGGTYTLDYLYSDGTDVYWHAYSVAQVKIDDASNFGPVAEGRQVMRSSSGMLYVPIKKGTSIEIWKSSSGISWKKAANTISGDLFGAAIDGNDTIHLVYSSTSTDVVYRTYSTSSETFGTAETLYTSPDVIGSASIAIDSNNKPHVIYSDDEFTGSGYTDTVYYDHKVSGTWTSMVVRTTEGAAYDIPLYVSITINPSNVAEMAWITFLTETLYAAQANTNNATSTTTQSLATSVGDGVSIATDSSSNTWVAYNNGTYIALRKHNSGDAWSTWQTAINDTRSGSNPEIAMSGSSVYLLYINGSSDVAYDVYSGSWSGETTLHTGTYTGVTVKWAYNFNTYGTSSADYIFSDGSDIYWNNLSLGSGSCGCTITISNDLTLTGAGNETVTAEANDPVLDINGSFTIGSGDTFSASSTSAFTLAGSFTNSGTFTANSGTVTLDTTTTATISGVSTTFNNFTSETSGKTIRFQKHTSNSPYFTFGGTFTITGTSGVGNKITIISDTTSSQWLAHFNSAQSSVTYADIKDSGCHTGTSNVTLTSSSTNSGNNSSCWVFPGANNNPNSPTSLAQKTTGDVTITTGGWHNTTSVKFTATASDTDSSDTLYLCVEKDTIGTSFSNTEDSCGTGVAYSGSGVSVSVTISGITDASEYHWQARVKDAASAYSSWVSYDVNAESARDFGIDTTAPTGGTVYDGTNVGSDASFNDGSLSSLSANWSGISSNVSGLSKYEYSIGTTAGGTNVKNWTDNSTNTSVTATGITLQSSQMYYVNVRTTDNAGNVATAISSNGVLIAPSLSFSLDSYNKTFSNLNAGNSYTDTKMTTLTTSTNAYNGYIVRAYRTDFLRSSLYPSTYIGDFDGGTYASPAAWGGSNYGFGYTSSDTTIQGASKFPASGSCAGGGTAPCYAPFSASAPGDIVADHTSTVTGTAVTNETFDITYKVKSTTTQTAGPYSSAVVYTVIPQY